MLSDPAEPPDASRSKAELWRRRLFLVIEVLFFVEMGIMLLVLPWTHVWTDSPILNSSLAVRQVAESGFVRGMVSGLGLINLWIAISDAVQYQE